MPGVPLCFKDAAQNKDGGRESIEASVSLHACGLPSGFSLRLNIGKPLRRFPDSRVKALWWMHSTTVLSLSMLGFSAIVVT